MEMSNYETMDVVQICVIVNFGLGSKVLHKAKVYGIPGGTVFLGKGTVNNRILEFFGLSDVRKEIVLMVAGRETAYRALDKLSGEFEFERPNHGIAFIKPVCVLAGAKISSGDNQKKERDWENMYDSITVIVDKGKAEYVIDAAVKAGSKGGTIINARGSGIHETSKLFSMDIEPEKEMVLILSEKESVDAIVSSIREDLKLDQPGKGILYVQRVEKTYGLHK